MFPLPERTVFLPSFDNDDLKKMRRNDRFAYGSVATMRVSAKEDGLSFFFFFVFCRVFSRSLHVLVAATHV